jgi:uncharacterized protein (DUF2062 family)
MQDHRAREKAEHAAAPPAAPTQALPAKRAARRFLVHPLAVLRRLLAEHATPRGLAVASAFGVMVGALPLLGFHTLLVIFGAQRLKLNRLMALAANQICIPPVVPAICIEAGYYMRTGTFLTEVSMRTLGREALERFWEWTLGSLVVGPVLAAATGAIIWAVAAVLQRRSVPGAPD